MNLINGITSLANRLDSLIDDSRNETGAKGIVAITSDSTGTKVQLDAPSFIESFQSSHYDVKYMNGFECPYYLLEIESDGVAFFCLLDDKELAIIESEHRNHYEYISATASV